MPNVFDEVVDEVYGKQTDAPKNVFDEAIEEDVTKTPKDAPVLHAASLPEQFRMSAPGRFLEEGIKPVAQIADTAFKFMTLPPYLREPAKRVIEQTPGIGLAKQYGPEWMKGVLEGGEEAAVSFPIGALGMGAMVPSSLATIGQLGNVTKAAAAGNAALNALFAGEYAISVPEMYDQFKKAQAEGRTKDAYTIATQAVANGLLVGVGGAHAVKGLKSFGKEKPYARSVEEAAEIYGNLRSQPRQGPPPLPTEGRGAGVLTPAQRVAEEAQIPLTIAEAQSQGPQAILDIMKKHGVDRDTAVAMQARARRIHGISKDVATGEKPPQTEQELITKLDAIEKKHGPLTEVDSLGNEKKLRDMVPGEKELSDQLTLLYKQREATAKEVPPIPLGARMPADVVEPPPVEVEHNGVTYERRNGRWWPRGDYKQLKPDDLLVPVLDRKAAAAVAAKSQPGASPEKLLSKFDAMAPTREAIESILAMHPEMDPPEAWQLLKQSRIAHGLPERIEELGSEGQKSAAATVTPAKPEQTEIGLKTEQGLPPGVVKNSTGTYSFIYMDGGIRKRADAKTLEELTGYIKTIQERAAARKEKVAVTKENPLAKRAQEKAQGKGAELFFTDDQLDPGNAPFAQDKAGIIARGRNGEIVINSRQFYKWLSRMPAELRDKAIDRLIDEERIHASTPDWMAKAYWASLTGLEKKLITKRYEGTWGTEESDLNMAHEALRGMIQQVSGKNTREFVESGLGERMTVGTVQALERAIFWLRRKWGTRASSIQKDMLDRAQKNLETMSQVLGGDEQAGPAAKDREAVIKDRQEYDELQGPFKESVTKFLNAMRSGDKEAMDAADAERIEIQKKIETIKNRHEGFVPDPSQFGPAAKFRAQDLDLANETREWWDRVMKHIDSLFYAGIDPDFIRDVSKGKHGDYTYSDILQQIKERGIDDRSGKELRQLYLSGSALGTRTFTEDFNKIAPFFDALTTGEGEPRIGPGVGPGAKVRTEGWPRGGIDKPIKEHHPVWGFPPMSRDMKENIVMRGEKGTKVDEEILKMGYEPNIYTALTRYAATDPSKWNMPNKQKAELLEWFNNARGTGWSREEILATGIIQNEAEARRVHAQLGDVQSFEDFVKGAGGDPSAKRMFRESNQEYIDYYSRLLQDLIDSAQESRRMLYNLIGTSNPKIERWLRPQPEPEPPKMRFDEETGEFVPDEDAKPLWGMAPEDHPDLPGLGPAAKSRKTKDSSLQTFMFFEDPKQEEFGFSKHPTAELSGAIQKPTREEYARKYLKGPIKPKDITEAAVSWMRPNFGQFVNAFRREMEMKHVQPEQVRKMWEDAVWDELQDADPVRLDLWRRALNLEKKLGKREIAGVMKAESRDEKLNLVKMDLTEVAKRREKEATKLEREARAIREKIDSNKYASNPLKPLELVELEGDATSYEYRAKQKRQEADDIMRSVREDRVEIPPQEELPEPEKPLPDLPGVSPETKSNERRAKSAALRRQAKALDEAIVNYHNEMVLAAGDEAKQDRIKAQIDQVFRKSEALKARADIVDAGGEISTVESRKGRPAQEMAAMSAQRYRSVVISSIANKLITESIPGANLARKEITLDDIDFSADVDEDPYFQIDARDLKNPITLRSVFKSGARRSNKDPVTVTKRLAVMQDKQTGEVYLLSSYLDGHKGVRVMQPNPSQIDLVGDHVPINNLLNRYRLLYSVLLKDPVQNFQQRFDNIAEYNRAIGGEARELAGNRRLEAMVGVAQAIDEDVLPPEEMPDLDLTKRIPVGGMLRSTYDINSGVTEASRRRPITASEAGSIVDWLSDTIGEVNTKEDFMLALDSLTKRAEETRQSKTVTKRIPSKENVLTPEALKARTFWQPLMGQHRQVISALTKIANSFMRRDPDVQYMDPAEIETASMKWMNQALDAVYEAVKASQYPLEIEGGPQTGIDADRFVQRILGQFTPPSREFGARHMASIQAWREQGREARVREGFEPAPKETGQELTMLSRVPPTTVRPEQLPPGTPIAERQPAPEKPEGTPGVVIPPAKLTEENAKFVEQRAAESIKYTATPEPMPDPTFIGPPEPEPPVFSFRPKGYPEPDTWGPYAKGRKRSLILGAWDRFTQSLASKFHRSATEDLIMAWADTARNKAAIFGQQAGDRVHSFSKPEDHMVRAAAKAMIASGGDPAKLRGFLKFIDTGELAATAELAKNDPKTRNAAREWLDAVSDLRAEVEFALANPTNQALLDTAEAARQELKAAYDFEVKNGIDLTWEPDYVPGRYEGEIFNDNAITWFDNKVLGKNFRKPKMFPNYYEAIANGPYIPKNLDIAKLVEHRVRQGMTSINPELYLKSLRNLSDPVSGEPVAMDAKRQLIPHAANPALGLPARVTLGKFISPSPEYKPLVLGVNRTPIYIREGYYDLVNLLTLRQGGVSSSPYGRMALNLTGFMKHGVALIFDSFHPLRIAQYSAAAHGLDASILGRGGFKALEYRDADIPRAVKNGWISKADADWALRTAEVTLPTGRKVNMTHRQLLETAIENGLNIGRVQDALYSDWLKAYDFLGKDARGNNLLQKTNRIIFDKMTRGLMAESAVKAFLEANRKYPNAKLPDLMRDVVKDVNLYYGNIGKQGWFQNPTWQEAGQLLFLAPQWVEGLLQKEIRTAFRLGTTLTGTSGLTARGKAGLPPMGMLGKGVGSGLVGYFFLTQAINMITRGKPTWQNDEREHMFDAWIPYANGGGFWLSPMSVFAEVTHDVVRLNATKRITWDAIRQIGENKMNTWGRALLVLATGRNALGEQATSTAGVLGAAASAAVPTPITLAKGIREGASMLPEGARNEIAKYAPGMVAKNPPGTIPRQMFASLGGVKVEPSKSPSQQMMNKGKDWMKSNGLEYRPYDLTPTDEPSYDKMRNALRNDDFPVAGKILTELRKHKTDDQIIHAMKVWVGTPFTNNKRMEKMFMASLSDADLDLYTKAVEERYAMLNKFYEWYGTKAPEP